MGLLIILMTNYFGLECTFHYEKYSPPFSKVKFIASHGGKIGPTFYKRFELDKSICGELRLSHNGYLCIGKAFLTLFLIVGK